MGLDPQIALVPIVALTVGALCAKDDNANKKTRNKKATRAEDERRGGDEERGKYDVPVDELEKVLFSGMTIEGMDLQNVLKKSLKQAKKTAAKHLNHELFKALEWPETPHQYINYLREFVRWIPHQDPGQAWYSKGTHREVFDRLCHFYFLVDQDVDVGGKYVKPQDLWPFKKWIKNIVKSWGSFLNSPDSFNKDILQSFTELAPDWEVDNSLIQGEPNNPSGWLTFNQFFARQLNPGLRPVTKRCDNSIVTSAADCHFREVFDIDEYSNVVTKNSRSPTLKGTHAIGSIKQLLRGSKYAESFANGKFSHYLLGPYSYHRYHVPVSGKVLESYTVQGNAYLQVSITQNDEGKCEFDAPDTAETGYEFSQMRGVLVIDTSQSEEGDIGLVAVLPVGMAQVHTLVLDAASFSVRKNNT